MRTETVTLPDDPRCALAEIAGYLRTMDRSEYRAVFETSPTSVGVHYSLGPKREFWNPDPEGYWQTAEWLAGLQDLAAECDRLAVPEPEVSKASVCFCFSGCISLGFGFVTAANGHWMAATIATALALAAILYGSMLPPRKP